MSHRLLFTGIALIRKAFLFILAVSFPVLVGNMTAVMGASHDAPPLVVNAVGDLAHPVQYYRQELEALDYRIHDRVMPILKQGDLNFVNLESPITDRSPVRKKMFAFNAPLASLTELSRAGFNLISLANNHLGDAGAAGIEETVAHLRQLSRSRPLYWAGAGPDQQTLFFSVPGHPQKIAFLALGSEEELPEFDVTRAAAQVQEAAGKADIVLVSVHAGIEYTHLPRASIVEGYRRLIDAGAAVIFGHHPHVAQGIEVYGRGIIFYSLGNYSLSSKTVRHHRTGAKLFAVLPTLTFQGNRINSVRVTPLYVNNSEPLVLGDGKLILQSTPFCPQVATGAFARHINEHLVAWSQQIAGNTTRFAYVGDVLEVEGFASTPPLGTMDQSARVNQ